MHGTCRSNVYVTYTLCLQSVYARIRFVNGTAHRLFMAKTPPKGQNDLGPSGTKILHPARVEINLNPTGVGSPRDSGHGGTPTPFSQVPGPARRRGSGRSDRAAVLKNQQHHPIYRFSDGSRSPGRRSPGRLSRQNARQNAASCCKHGNLLTGKPAFGESRQNAPKRAFFATRGIHFQEVSEF